MSENKQPSNLVIDQKTFNKMIDTAVVLVEEIQSNSRDDLEVTVAEADFANAFVEYSHALINAIKESKTENGGN
jgi:hypothetical protein